MKSEQLMKAAIVSPEEAMGILNSLGPGKWRNDEIVVRCEALVSVSDVVKRATELRGLGVKCVGIDDRPVSAERLRIGFQEPVKPV